MTNFVTRLFNHNAEKALAKDISAQIVKNLSPKLMNERRQVLSANKISRLLEQSYEIAKAYQSTHKLGTVKRAVLANTFRWELKSAGYPEDFINVATEGLIIELGKKPLPKAIKTPKAIKATKARGDVK